MKRNEQIRAEAHRRYNGSTFFELKFIEGAEWADAHPRWISVEDELPPKNSEYDDNSIEVLATDGNRVYKAIYRICEFYSGWVTYDFWPLDNITHWMPLPAPPKKGSTRLPYEKEEISPNCIIGTPEHIQVALDVINKKGGEQ